MSAFLNQLKDFHTEILIKTSRTFHKHTDIFLFGFIFHHFFTPNMLSMRYELVNDDQNLSD